MDRPIPLFLGFICILKKLSNGNPYICLIIKHTIYHETNISSAVCIHPLTPVGYPCRRAILSTY